MFKKLRKFSLWAGWVREARAWEREMNALPFPEGATAWAHWREARRIAVGYRKDILGI